MAKMKFNFGRARSAPGTPPPSVQMVCKFLRKLRDGRLLTMREVARGSRLSESTFTTMGLRPEFSEFRFVMNARNIYWGNPRTIKAARKEFGTR